MKTTPKQTLLLDALCKYGSSKAVAKELDMTPRAVEVAVTRLLEQYDLPNRVVLAVEWDRFRRKNDRKKVPMPS